jgi:hypothetical protein
MKLEKLDLLEEEFLKAYPEGFESPELVAIKKKHKMDKMQTFVSTHFTKSSFEDPLEVFEQFTKLISKSSLVSVFEKTQFRNDAKIMSDLERQSISNSIYEFLYGNQGAGFEGLIDVLTAYKLAKWPILTVIGLYMHPEYEVLVKPTTVKGILKYFEVEEFKYTSKPNYAFYEAYRTLINEIKEDAGNHLKVDNAAFCGFLMMTIKK